MKFLKKMIVVFILINFCVYGQESTSDIRKNNKTDKLEKVYTPLAITDEIKFKNEGGSAIITITDEGSNAGSILFPSVGSLLTGSKLYSNGVNLFWGNSQLNGSNGVTTINDLSDAQYDLSSLYLGSGAGGINDDGGNLNVAVGENALNLNTSGRENTAIGNFVLRSNTSGAKNTGTGYGALEKNTIGHDNTANGFGALGLNTSGNFNTAIGVAALAFNSTGYENTTNGYAAMILNSTGYQNTANGFQSLFTNSTGYENAAYGSNALYSNTTGKNNTASGSKSLYSNTTGQYNAANGSRSLYSNTTGQYNAANGSDALYSNTIGSYNTANGSGALYANTNGSSNTANGYGALFYNTTGGGNTATGHWALYLNKTGEYNTATGASALHNNTTGNENIAIGLNSLFFNKTGEHNTGIGNWTGSSSFALGDLDNTTSIGYGATVTASNTISIGNTSVTSIKGQVGFSTFSDGRYKNNIQEDVKGIEFIMGLRPVTYNLDIELIANKLQEDVRVDLNGIKTKTVVSTEVAEARTVQANRRNTGFIAQEVEELANDLNFEFSGIDVPQNEESMYSLRYAEFVVPMVKAIQEQQQLIADLQNQIDELKKR